MNRRTQALLLARRYPNGIEAISQAMGKSPETLRKELTGAHGYKWGVDDEELMISLCQAAKVADPLAPIAAAALNAGAMLVELATADGENHSLKDLAEAAREFGEFVATYAAAVADGKVNGNELKDIEREAGELMTAMQHCLREARKQHEAAKPAHLRAVGE
jgi:hypothetical protein